MTSFRKKSPSPIGSILDLMHPFNVYGREEATVTRADVMAIVDARLENALNQWTTILAFLCVVLFAVAACHRQRLAEDTPAPPPQVVIAQPVGAHRKTDDDE